MARWATSAGAKRLASSFAAKIRRGVPERHLQGFLGHKNVQSTRRYARLADNTLIGVLRPSKTPWRYAGDKDSATG
jgi:site-specific recombinase XerD